MPKQDAKARWRFALQALSFSAACMTTPLRMRRASVMALRTLGSMDSALKLMKQPQDEHCPWKPSRRRETRSEKRALHRLQVTLIFSVMGTNIGMSRYKTLKGDAAI